MVEPRSGSGGREPTFAHPSEEEFARLLDFYQIEWQYEPQTFVLQRYGNGSVKEAFTPDFYLPAQHLYVELTTLDQNLMRSKRKKIQRLRQLYPDVNIKLFDRRDFRWLLRKYDLDDRSDDLIGKKALEP